MVNKSKQYVTDTSVILNDALDNGKRVLFEGAQGVMLDIDRNYPFVTLQTQSQVGWPSDQCRPK